MLQLLLVLLLLAPLAASPQSRGTTSAQQHRRPNIVFWKISPKSVDLLLGHVPQTDDIRLAQLKQTFTDLQCGGKRLQEQTTPEGRNLLCTLPAAGLKTASGKDGGPRIILVLAHYEHEGQGQSAVENWSGALMLPFLYHALSAAPRRHTFVFAEVDGEHGAAALFDSFTAAQRREILGVVALDALGLGPARFYINPNDSSAYLAWMRLERPLLRATADQRLPAPDEALPGSWSKIDVTRIFRHHDVPSILIHSVEWSARDIPGSARDTEAAIDRDTYMQTITLLADYAAELDGLQPSPHQ